MYSTFTERVILETDSVKPGSSMSSSRHSGPTRLTVVGAPPRDATRKAAEPDWSGLMARAQDGDRQAYRALLEGVTPYLRSLAARYLKQAGEVEDAVQDVLLTVHLVRHAYDPNRPFGPWLVAIANRRFIDRLRRASRLRAREVALAAEHETFPQPPTNLDGEMPDHAALDDAIDRLSPEQRQAVTLLKLNELSLKEASALSGRSIAALKVATHRAIKNLRAIVKKQSE